MVKQYSRAADNPILERFNAVQGLVSELANVIKETGLEHKFSIEKTNFGYQIKHIGKPKNLAKDAADLAADLVWHGNSSIIDTIDARNDKLRVVEPLFFKLSREGNAFLYNAGEYQGHTLVSAIPQVVKKKVKPNGNAIASVNFDTIEPTLDDYVSEHIRGICSPALISTLAFPIIGMVKQGQGKQQESEIGATPEDLKLTPRAPKSTPEELRPEDSYGNARAPTDAEQLTEVKQILKNTIDELETGKVSKDDDEGGQEYAERLASSKNPASTLGEDYDPRTGKELTSEQLAEKQKRGIGGTYLSEADENAIQEEVIAQKKRDTLGLGRPASKIERMLDVAGAATLAEEERKKREDRQALMMKLGAAAAVVGVAAAAAFGGGIIKYTPNEPPGPGPGPDNPDTPIDPNYPDWTFKTDIAPSLSHIADKEAVTGQTILVPMHVADNDIAKYGDKIDRDLKYEDTKQIIKSSKGGNDTGAFEISFDNEGNYLLNASVKDKVGKEDYQTFWANITKKPDVVNEKPEITSVRVIPTGKPGEHMLSATATDKDTGVGGIEILLDGNSYAIVNTDKFEEIINEKDFQPGNYTFSAVAWDADDPSLTSENNPTANFHSNFPPTMDIAVKNIGGDEYEFDIRASGIDNNLNSVEVYRTDTDTSLLIESLKTKDFVRNVRWDFEEDIGDIPLVFYATDGIHNVSVEKTINTLNDLIKVDVNFTQTGHDTWDYKINYDAIDNDVKSVSVISTGLDINRVNNVDTQKGTISGDINASKTDAGTYALDVVVKDDLGQEFKSNIDIVVEDHAITAIYNVYTNDNKIFNVEVIGEKDHTDITDVAIKLTGDNFELTKEYNELNITSINLNETFDASLIAPQPANVTVDIKNALGANELQYKKQVQIGDALAFIESLNASYNPVNDLLKINSAAKDNDTNIQDLEYEIRKVGQANVLSGSLLPVDGAFDSKQENANRTIDTSTLEDKTIYELAVTPKSNSVDGNPRLIQFEVNRSYQIVPVFNPNKDAIAGSLAWNETAGKAELTLVGNNTFFKNWEDEWANVTPGFKAAVLANWSEIDATSPMAAADWLQNQLRNHYGGLFSDSDVFNVTRRDFVGTYEKIRDDVLSNPAVPQADKDKWKHDRLTVTNIQQFRPIGSWSRNVLHSKVSYDANQNGQLPQNDGSEYLAYEAAFAGTVYSTFKSAVNYITEEDEWKADADDPFEPTVWKAFNNFHKTNFTETNFTLDPSVYSALDDQLDDPIGSKYDELLKLGLMLETWENAGYTSKLKVSYDIVNQEYTFSV